MKYGHVLFDLDHTLLDSDGSEAAAFGEAMRRSGVEDALPLLPRYREVNRGLWRALERGELSLSRLRVQRFEDLAAAAKLELDAEATADHFSDLLGEHGELYEGARAALEALASRVRLALVTNGVGRTQRRRIDRLGLRPFFDGIAISGELGTAKPGTEIFDEALRQLGDPPRERVLMVGDNLSSDIAGANASGIDACWLNPAGKANAAGVPVTHEVTRLETVLEIVGSVAAG